MGYQVAQSNAAWLLDKFPSQSGCLGSSGDLCSVGERHQRANRLWTLASEQGDVEAALLVGDAYYYGKVGTSKQRMIMNEVCNNIFVFVIHVVFREW